MAGKKSSSLTTIPIFEPCLALLLKHSDYDIVEMATGLEALNQARATRPDLILMDLSMPVVNGDEALAWLKADPLTRDILVIVTTAFLDGPLVDRALALGAAEILNKPFHFESLHASGIYQSTSEAAGHFRRPFSGEPFKNVSSHLVSATASGFLRPAKRPAVHDATLFHCLAPDPMRFLIPPFMHRASTIKNRQIVLVDEP